MQYLTTVRYLRGDNVLAGYWRAGYPPSPLAGGGLLRWVGYAAPTFARDPLHLAYPALVGVLLLLGAVCLARRRPVALALVLAAVAVQLSAALARAYPFSGRLALDLVPLALVLLAASLTPALTARLPSVAVGVGACAGLVTLLLSPAQAAVQLTEHPLTITEFRPVMTAVSRQYRPRDKLLLYWFTGAAATIYAQRVSVHVDGFTGVFSAAGRCDDTAARAALAGGRLWVLDATLDPKVVPGTSPLGRSGDVAALRAAWQRLAVPQLRISSPGVTATLYTPRTRVTPPPAAAGCLDVFH